MNLSEVNWDFNAAGTWPLPIKIATIVYITNNLTLRLIIKSRGL